jgi:hypothetical protein
MSHQTKIRTSITDPEALLAACKEMGLALVPNSRARVYGGTQSQVNEFTIVCPGEYDVSVNKSTDGSSYELSTDWYMGSVEKAVGKQYGKLKQLYGVHKAQKEARKLGYFATRTVNAQGQPRLVVTSNKF